MPSESLPDRSDSMRRRLDALSPEQRRQFIANGLDDELPDRFSTHCSKCGMHDRIEGAEVCVRCRDKWTCTAIIDDPHPTRRGQKRRCVVTGSEVVVRNGQTYCPRHIPIPEGGLTVGDHTRGLVEELRNG